MKKSLELLLSAAFFLSVSTVTAQVTQLANNKNLKTGVPLGSNEVMLTIDDSLWVTSGTAASTKKLVSNVKWDNKGAVAVFSGKLYFSGKDSLGSELWVTDGTVVGTKLLVDLYKGPKSSTPTSFVVFKGALYFYATTKTKGAELWKTDGTKGGTILVKDINPGTAGSFVDNGTYFLDDSIAYFTANDGTHGSELWRTNGTTAGTYLLKDINPGADSSQSFGLTKLGTKIIFSADDGTHDQEPWITDGTSGGTTILKDISSFPGFGSNPSGFLFFKNKLYFSAYDLFTSGLELWVTDGTPGGTTLFKDIDAGASNSSAPELFDAIVFPNKFIFSAMTKANGRELWVCDGTPGGTTLFKDIRTGKNGSDPFIFLDFGTGGGPGSEHTKLYNGKIFFSANDSTHGNEVWVTDGTAAGTKLVKDINSGTASSINNTTFNYIYTKKGLYSSATDSKGSEPWKIDTSASKTTMVADIFPGSGSSSPNYFFGILNHHILISADNGDNGTGRLDLYQIDQSVDTLALQEVTAMANPKSTNSIKVFPNPAKDNITVTIGNTDAMQGALTITAINGKQLFSRNLSLAKGNSLYNLNISFLAKGMYYLQLNTDKGSQTVKFIKE